MVATLVNGQARGASPEELAPTEGKISKDAAQDWTARASNGLLSASFNDRDEVFIPITNDAISKSKSLAGREESAHDFGSYSSCRCARFSGWTRHDSNQAASR